MALKEPVLTGAIAIIKVGNIIVGHMRNVRVNENIRRVEIRPLGTILPQEAAAVEWSGTISCSFFELSYKIAGLEKAIRRDVGVGNAPSQVAFGINSPNFEDNLVLDTEGVSLNIYKKLKDAGSPDPNTGLIIPNKTPYAIIGRCFIETDNVNIDESNVSGRDQTFRYLDPIVYS